MLQSALLNRILNDPSFVVRQLHTSNGSAEFSDSQVIEAMSEIEKLAKAAYREDKSQSFECAERLLHLIHTQSSFSIPFHPLLSRIWNELMAAKISSCLIKFGGTGPIGPEQMQTELKELLDLAEAQDHPVLDRLVDASSEEGLRVYTKNWFASTFGFNHQMIALAQRAPEDVRQAVLKNLSDEYTGTPHHELRERWLKRIGLSYEPAMILKDRDYLIEAVSLQNFRTGICQLGHAAFALGSFYSIEAIFPGVCRRLLRLRPKGFDDGSLELFSNHVETDEDHAREWLENITLASLTPKERGFVVDGAKCQMKLRSAMFSKLGKRFE